MIFPVDRGGAWLMRAVRRADPRRPLEAIYWRFVQPVWMRFLLHRAGRRRPRYSSVVFIGVTGSAGKTNTKNLAAPVLSAGMPGRKGGAANERRPRLL